MSKAAMVMLVAGLFSLAGAILVPVGFREASNILALVSACFGVLFVLALIRGKRIKFNPQLR